MDEPTTTICFPRDIAHSPPRTRTTRHGRESGGPRRAPSAYRYQRLRPYRPVGVQSESQCGYNSRRNKRPGSWGEVRQLSSDSRHSHGSLRGRGVHQPRSGRLLSHRWRARARLAEDRPGGGSVGSVRMRLRRRGQWKVSDDSSLPGETHQNWRRRAGHHDRPEQGHRNTDVRLRCEPRPLHDGA